MGNKVLIQGKDPSLEKGHGVFVDGFIVSSSATAFDRKDGWGKACW